jgi:6-pyruvoyl-tetrahydropterin synthase
MAEIGTAQRFHASHGKDSHEHDFKVVAVLAGTIDKDSGYIENVDHNELISRFKQILSALESKDLNDVLRKDGFRSSGMESIASYVAIRLLPHYSSLKLVKVWETDDRYVIVYPKDIKNE